MEVQHSPRNKYLLKLAFGCLLFSLLFLWVDWNKTIEVFRRVYYLPAITALFFPLAGIFLSSFRWAHLLKIQGISIRFRNLFNFYWIGCFFSNFFPSNIGGDFVRVALFRNTGRLLEVSASIFMERLIGVFALVLLSALAFWIKREWLLEINFVPTSVLAKALLVSGLVLTIALVFAFAVRLVWPKIRFKLNSMKDLLVSYRAFPYSMLFNFVLAVVFYMLIACFHYFSFVAFGVDISFVDVFLNSIVITFVSTLPVTPNAIGVAEGAFVFFYGRLGVLPSEAFAVAILCRILWMALSSVGGVIWISERRDLSLQ